MAKLVWTEEAVRWLENIFEYIAEDNPQAATETVQGIYDRTQALIDFPEMGQRYQGSKRNVRILLYGHYRIAHLVKPESIEILGVFHGALDIGRYSL
jgi:plasmid stabilization system protein ParE